LSDISGIDYRSARSFVNSQTETRTPLPASSSLTNQQNEQQHL
jgi:hypothetical protein